MDVDDVAFSTEVRERFRSYLVDEVNPGAEERDLHEQPIPRALMQRAVEVGLFQLPLPKALGGGGLDVHRWGLVLEQVGYLCEDASFPTLVSLRSAVAAAIFETGRADLIERYALPMARGTLNGALAYSDAADPFAFQSNVKREGDTCVLNGEKFLVTGGVDADVFMTYLRVESGDMVAVLIERGDEGVSTAAVPVIGLRSMGLSNFKFKDTRVPASRLIVERDGLSHAQRMLNARRVLLPCAPLGCMTATFELCVEALRGTRRYQQSVLELPNVQSTLGRMWVDIESSRALLYAALRRAATGSGGYDPLFDPLVSAAKYHVAERSIEVLHHAFRLLGGKGYTRALRVERFLRDAYGLMAGGGAQDILEIQLGVAAVSRVEQRLKGGK